MFKKVLLALIATLTLSSVAIAQTPAPLTRAQYETSLMGFGMPGPLAELISQMSTGLAVQANNQWLMWRNAAGTANINVLKVDGSDDTWLNADSGDIIRFGVAGTPVANIDADEIYPASAASMNLGSLAGTPVPFGIINWGDGTRQGALLDSDSNNSVVIRSTTNHPIEFRINNTEELFLSDNTLRYTGNTGALVAPTAIAFQIGATPAAEVNVKNGELELLDAPHTIEGAGGLILSVDADAQRLFTFDASSDTALTLTYGDGGTTAAQTMSIHGSTADADDDSALAMGGGGAMTVTRGAGITLRGNENTSGPDVLINSGQAAGGDIFITTNQAGDGEIIMATGNATTTLTLSHDQSALFTGTVRSSAASDIGWSVVAAANQACNTTCTSACVVGQNSDAAGVFVGCADAAADVCLCAGAS